MLLDIDLSTFQNALKIKKEAGKTYIYAPIRKKFLVLQPEELVRQLMLCYLIQDRAYNKNFIRTEQGLKVNKLFKRCDILIYDKNLNPYLLVECKSSKVKISQNTFEQIARYNLPLKVKYLVVTNGPQTYCCQMDYDLKKYIFLDHIPKDNF